MRGEDIAETIDDMRHHVIDDLVSQYIPENAYAEQWDAQGLREKLRETIALDLPADEWAKEEGIADEEIRERVAKAADEFYVKKRETYTPEIMTQVEKAVLLQTLDHLWREHIVTVEHLRQVIHLRGYGQRDPLNEYKTEGFTLFETMIARLRELTTSQIMRVELTSRPPDDLLPDEDELPPMVAHHIDPTTGQDDVGEGMIFGQEPPTVRNKARAAATRDPSDPTTWGKVGRNDQCPCGSGKKYKHCHGTYV
jgi:preprotein translocase subunit SecA